MQQPIRPPRTLAIFAGFALLLFACNSSSSSSKKASSSSVTSSSATTASSTPASKAKAPTVTITLAPWKLARPSARQVVLADNGSLLVLGGFDGAKRTIAQVLRVNVATGTSTDAGTLSQAVHDAAGASVSGAPTVFGGGNTAETAAVQRYVSGGTATVAGRLPIPRSDLAAVAVGSRAYIIGGYDGARVRATTIGTSDGIKFDILGDLPVPVRYPAVAAQGTDVIVVGGTTRGTDSTAGDTTAVQVLDTRTGAVRVLAQLPKTLAHATAATVRGQVYVFGGRWGGVPTNQVWRWDSASAMLVPVGTMAAAVTDGAAATIGDTAYFVGGESPNPIATVTELRAR